MSAFAAAFAPMTYSADNMGGAVALLAFTCCDPTTFGLICGRDALFPPGGPDNFMWTGGALVVMCCFGSWEMRAGRRTYTLFVFPPKYTRHFFTLPPGRLKLRPKSPVPGTTQRFPLTNTLRRLTIALPRGARLPPSRRQEGSPGCHTGNRADTLAVWAIE